MVLGAHPLQAFPDVRRRSSSPGSSVAVAARRRRGSRWEDQLALDAGGNSFRLLADEDRALYHAAAVFSSNYLVALQGAAEELFAAAGVEEPLRRFAPLAEATIDNVLRARPSRPALHEHRGARRRGDRPPQPRGPGCPTRRGPWGRTSRSRR